MKRQILLTAFLVLGGCTMNYTASDYLRHKNLHLTQTTLPHCSGYGCIHLTHIDMTDNDWAQLKKIMSTPETSAQERKNIKKAIAAFETIIGEKAGTASDKGGTFKHLTADGKQLDCVDESNNTTIYLQDLYQRGLLKFHTPGAPTTRLPLIHAGRWPHRAAIIIETASGEKFAVDSWFHDNGVAPEIVPIKQWKEGWKPN